MDVAILPNEYIYAAKSCSMKYTCDNCGKQHEEWPAIAWSSPSAYNELNEEERKSYGYLSGDFCVITYPDQIDRFIRAVLIQKVYNNCQTLDYGVWVTLSENSFTDYKNKFDQENDREAVYFGYLNNLPPEYEFMNGIKTNVIVKNGHGRPEVVPHHSGQMHIPIVEDYYKGISTEEALKRLENFTNMLSNT